MAFFIYLSLPLGSPLLLFFIPVRGRGGFIIFKLFLSFFVESFQSFKLDFFIGVDVCHENCFLDSCSEPAATDEIPLAHLRQLTVDCTDDNVTCVEHTRITWKGSIKYMKQMGQTLLEEISVFLLPWIRKKWMTIWIWFLLFQDSRWPLSFIQLSFLNSFKEFLMFNLFFKFLSIIPLVSFSKSFIKSDKGVT